MTRVVEAIYVDGVLRPLDPLDLAEQQRVRVTVETIDAHGDGDRSEKLKRLMNRLERSPLSYGGKMPSRDELHDR